MRAVGVLIVSSVALAAAACSDDRTASRTSDGRPSTATANQRPSRDLAVLARELVPRSAATLAPSELEVRECGIAPTFPCVEALLKLHGRRRGIGHQVQSLRALAASRGWHLEGIKVTAGGRTINLVRGRLHARYQLARGLTGADLIATLTLVGPPHVTPPPSAAAKARWTDAKRRFVTAANAVCAQTIGRRAVEPEELPDFVREAEQGFAMLKAPPGDERAVAAIKRALDQLNGAVHALAAARGEEGLPAAVAVGEYAKRFDKAARRYGLDRCAAR
jgi:hypothetical protein